MNGRLLRSPALIGILLSLASLPIHLMLERFRSVELAAVLVAAIGAIYVGFALQRGTAAQMTIEIAVAVLFFGAAILGLWVTPWVIPVAYAAHGLWDIAHHRKDCSLVRIPKWYPSFCAAYDWVYAAGLLALWQLR